MTHGHDDHAGSASWFQSKGAQVYVGAGDEKSMSDGNFGSNSPFTNHVMPPCHPDVCMKEDMDICAGGLRIHALRMPGHTNGSMIYYLTLDEEVLLLVAICFLRMVKPEKKHIPAGRGIWLMTAPVCWKAF